MVSPYFPTIQWGDNKKASVRRERQSRDGVQARPYRSRPTELDLTDSESSSDSNKSTGSNNATVSSDRLPDTQLKYKPLRPGHIRTIRLKAQRLDDSKDILQCSFGSSDVDLSSENDTKHYGAMSFEWGAPKDRDKGLILVDGQPLRIPLNLEEGLRAIRRRMQAMRTGPEGKAPRALPRVWADAICINQADGDEKIEQIQMMGTIFQRADPLYIWIGRGGYLNVSAIKVFREIAIRLGGRKKSRLKDLEAPEYRNPSITDTRFMAIDILLQNSYFKRSWIIQEIMQPRTQEVRIFCGAVNVRWDDAEKALQLIREHEWVDDVSYAWLRNLELPVAKARRDFQAERAGHEACSSSLANDESNIQAGSSNDRGRDGNNSSRAYSLSSNLFTFRANKCTYPEDKIWSIRSICTGLNDDELVPRAGEQPSAGSIYYRATALALQDCRSLDLLSLCRQYNNEIETPKSWVPDYWSFAEKPTYRETLATWHSYTKALYSATGDSEAEVSVSSDGILTAKGKVVARVKDTTKLTDMEPKKVEGEDFNLYLLRWSRLYHACHSWLTQNEDTAWRLWHFMAVNWPRDEVKPERPKREFPSDGLWKDIKHRVSNPSFQGKQEAYIWHEILNWQTLQDDRGVAITEDERLVQVPLDCRVGDEIVLLKGAKVPFLRRRKSDDPDAPATLIGECRLEGCMDGEMWPDIVADGSLQDLAFE